MRSPVAVDRRATMPSSGSPDQRRRQRRHSRHSSRKNRPSKNSGQWPPASLTARSYFNLPPPRLRAIQPLPIFIRSVTILDQHIARDILDELLFFLAKIFPFSPAVEQRF